MLHTGSLSRTEGTYDMTKHENVVPTQQRLEECAQQVNAIVPAPALSNDGAPSEAVLDFCNKHEFSLDYIYSGKLPMRRAPKGNRNWVPQEIRTKIAHIAGLMRAGQCADETLLIMKDRGVGAIFEVAEGMLNEVLKDIDRSEAIADTKKLRGQMTESEPEGGEC